MVSSGIIGQPCYATFTSHFVILQVPAHDKLHVINILYFQSSLGTHLWSCGLDGVTSEMRLHMHAKAISVTIITCTDCKVDQCWDRVFFYIVTQSKKYMSHHAAGFNANKCM